MTTLLTIILIIVFAPVAIAIVANIFHAIGDFQSPFALPAPKKFVPRCKLEEIVNTHPILSMLIAVPVSTAALILIMLTTTP